MSGPDFPETGEHLKEMNELPLEKRLEKTMVDVHDLFWLVMSSAKTESNMKLMAFVHWVVTIALAVKIFLL